MSLASRAKFISSLSLSIEQADLSPGPSPFWRGARSSTVSRRLRRIREQTFAGDVVHLDSDAVGVLEQERIVAGRPTAGLRRMDDPRAHLFDEGVDRIDIGALSCAKA